MKRICLKSIICGFVLGSILFAIAPLGLGISLIEFLKPVLAPGTLITPLIFGNSAGAITIVVALTINGVMFTIPFLCYFLTRKSSSS